ncbi:hypothetical protein [Actinopolymorpha rutila]|uniref:Uncharacterized protein n=1 Tax=Actinopolymorpha rutila TaxID=446787 RepID=A0A852Z7Q1_9ACTN|nr:hypothetical protein [Actinopolymorpha rutila]NYH87658.1 hypothetical protein [Actinopolymorpha rutila]
MTEPSPPPSVAPGSGRPTRTGSTRGRGRRSGRSAERLAFVANRAGSYDPGALTEAMGRRLREEESAAEAAAKVAAPGERMRIFPAGDTHRWVPIGPSVIRAKERFLQASWPRATGRVRDLAVSADGRRAYAATAKGGVWYTDDGGATWSPVGGWAVRAAVHGGVHNAQACGSLLVAFAEPPGPDPAADAAQDFVLVGTGEPQGFGRPPARPALAGRGVLAARGPATKGGADPTWEPEAGISVLEGAGVFALARDPLATAGQSTGSAGSGLDRVVAGTDRGLFLGTRRPAGPPHNGEFAWAPLPALGTFLGLGSGQQPLVTAALWLPRSGDANGRILLAVARGLESATPGVFAPTGSGVAYTDDLGASFHWVAGLDPTASGAMPLVGRMSLAVAEADRVYVLGDQQPGAPSATVAGVWRIAAAASATPTAESIAGVPTVWQGNSLGKNQRDYDQTIAVDVVGGVDRIYLAGNTSDAGASLWCLDVSVGPALVPTAGVSRTGVPPGGEHATSGGLIGDGVHPDVHMIRLAGTHPNRQVWVGTDGGVFVSTHAGRVNTFAPRATGMAALEVNFVAAHPTSSHFAAIGTQDNGRHSRVGDTVWEDTMGGDGGGVAFHPRLPQVIVSQYFRASWEADPMAGFVNPLDQGSFTVDLRTDRESNLSAFYSGPSAVRRTATAAARLVIGTNRVWLSDNVGFAAPNSWQVLPFPGGPAVNPRAGGRDLPANRAVGVPAGAPLPPAVNGTGPLGEVVTAKWVSERVLLVLFANGVVRWTQDATTARWSARCLVAPAGVVLAPPVTGAPDPAVSMLSDLAPVPESNDFYLVTTGDPGSPAAETCLFFSDVASAFFPTTLRAQLPPLDPAYAVVVDPQRNADVYVGTVTGVWKGERGAGPPAAGQPWPHAWATDVNGLPQAAVQDLHVWVDPSNAAGSPRLLRAAFQSRGVWERDLSVDDEPQRTYLRVHARDDRRRLPTPMANPRLSPTRPPVVPYASRDIMIRPRANPASAPTWRFRASDTIDETTVSAGTATAYQLWTFQTAFRWLYPSVNADGRWTDTFGALVELHRSTDPTLGPVQPKINRALWDAVVGGTRLTAGGAVSSNATDPLAVYRPAWHTPLAMSALATEIDLLENVVHPRIRDDVAHVFAEWNTVDVLIHHRDMTPVPAGDAFVLLLWRHATSRAALLATDVSPIPAYVNAVLGTGPVPTAPTGWDRAVTTTGSPRIPLPAALDARMPRAVPVDVNLSTAAPDDHYLFLAIAGSTADPCSLAPVGLPTTPKPADLARGWPYAALRLVRVLARP